MEKIHGWLPRIPAKHIVIAMGTIRPTQSDGPHFCIAGHCKNGVAHIYLGHVVQVARDSRNLLAKNISHRLVLFHKKHSYRLLGPVWKLSTHPIGGSFPAKLCQFSLKYIQYTCTKLASPDQKPSPLVMPPIFKQGLAGVRAILLNWCFTCVPLDKQASYLVHLPLKFAKNRLFYPICRIENCVFKYILRHIAAYYMYILREVLPPTWRIVGVLLSGLKDLSSGLYMFPNHTGQIKCRQLGC